MPRSLHHSLPHSLQQRRQCASIQMLHLAQGSHTCQLSMPRCSAIARVDGLPPWSGSSRTGTCLLYKYLLFHPLSRHVYLHFHLIPACVRPAYLHSACTFNMCIHVQQCIRRLGSLLRRQRQGDVGLGECRVCVTTCPVNTSAAASAHQDASSLLPTVRAHTWICSAAPMACR